MPPPDRRDPVSAGTIARYTLVVIAIIVTTLFIWQIKEALLAAFAGVILAVVITGTARGIMQYVPLSRSMFLDITIINL